MQRQKIEIPSLSVPSGDDPNTTLKPSFKLFSCPTIEEDVEQEDEIMPDDCRTLVRETVNDNHESLIVNGIGQPTLDGYVDEMVDDTSCVDIIMPGSSFRFSDMEINGSGLESGVQHSTKRMRTTQLRKVSI
ncbi:uncharacterized protein LOC143584039 [Bidens hawaiensis]|uniref:uncharacterized protein LOC143584039 n=1 Tax=Bidens hawaiensis TaxID=980011 RepID=UPI00404B1FFE